MLIKVNIKVNTRAPTLILQSHWGYTHNIKVQLVEKSIGIGKGQDTALDRGLTEAGYQNRVRQAQDLFGQEAGKGWDKPLDQSVDLIPVEGMRMKEA